MLGHFLMEVHMEENRPVMELWTPESWIEKVEELQQIPVAEMTFIQKYQLAGIVAWAAGAPYFVLLVAGVAYSEYRTRQEAKQIGMNP